MSKISATITIQNSEKECDRIFSDKRNLFRGLFDIADLKSERKGKWNEGISTYSFTVNCHKNDAPVVLSILKEFGFTTKYV
jgi:hypothetical protein